MIQLLIYVLTLLLITQLIKKEINKIKKIKVSNKQHHNRIFYILDLSINLYKFINDGIRIENNKFMYEFIGILLSNLSILTIKNNYEKIWSGFFDKTEDYISIRSILQYSDWNKETNLNLQLESELNKYKEKIFSEWENDLYKITKVSFHKKNMERLSILNNYVLSEIDKNKKCGVTNDTALVNKSTYDKNDKENDNKEEKTKND